MTFFDELLHKGFVGMYLGDNAISTAIVYYGLYFGVPVLCAVIAYFLGCINFGIILSRKKYNEDIRTKGSGNAGATNMLRTYGKGMAAATFIGDFLKGAVAAAIGIAAFGGIGGFIAAFGAMVGHAFPCFYGFKGGKGVAVSAGAILVIDWRVFLFLIAVFVLIVWFTKFISLGSVTAFFLLPLLVFHMSVNSGRIPAFAIIFAFCMMGLGIYLHRSNIKRIAEGCESKVSFKSKKNEEAYDDSDDE